MLAKFNLSNINQRSLWVIPFREAWNLWVLTLWLLVGVLLIIPAPLAIRACAGVCRRMLDDKSVQVTTDLKWLFKKASWRVSLSFYAVLLPLWCIPAYGVFIYGQLTALSVFYMIPTLICVSVLMMWHVVIFAFLIVGDEDDIFKSIKTALLMQLKKPSIILKVNMLLGLFVIMTIILFPLSSLLIFIGGLALFLLLMSHLFLQLEHVK